MVSASNKITSYGSIRLCVKRLRPVLSYQMVAIIRFVFESLSL
jgi:hypothetical protein